MMSTSMMTVIKFSLASLVMVLLFLVMLSIENGYSNHFFASFGIYPKQEEYTVLFFNESEKLSSEIISGEKFDFTFGVKNVEGRDMNYRFVVEVLSGSKSTLVDSGSLFVKSNETNYKTIELNKAQYSKGSLVYVILPLHNKSIDFIIN